MSTLSAESELQSIRGKRAAMAENPPAPPAVAAVEQGESAEETPIPLAPPPRRRRPSRRLVLLFVLAALIVGAIIGVRYWIDSRHYESTDDAFIEGHVVPISPQISAQVAAVHVSDNAFVHKGDLLIELDPIDYQAAVEQVRGAEAAARGKLEQARSQVMAARSALQEAQAAVAVETVKYANADLDLKRYQGLDERARTKQQYDNAASAPSIRPGHRSKRPRPSWRRPNRRSPPRRRASPPPRATSPRRWLMCTRRKSTSAMRASPLRRMARITRKNVEPGSYVTAGQTLLAIVPTDVWVVANFKETQLDLMRPGQPVRIFIDAYPEKEFTGKIDSIQSGTGSRFSMLPAENATGNYVKVVQRVPVKITLDPGQTEDINHLLAPGMSAEPSVKVR